MARAMTDLCIDRNFPLEYAKIECLLENLKNMVSRSVLLAYLSFVLASMNISFGLSHWWSSIMLKLCFAPKVLKVQVFFHVLLIVDEIFKMNRIVRIKVFIDALVASIT